MEVFRGMPRRVVEGRRRKGARRGEGGGWVGVVIAKCAAAVWEQTDSTVAILPNAKFLLSAEMKSLSQVTPHEAPSASDLHWVCTPTHRQIDRDKQHNVMSVARLLCLHNR